VLRGVRYKPIVWTTNDFADLDRTKIGLKGSPTIVGKTWVPETKQVETELLEAESTEAVVDMLLSKLTQTELPTKLGWALEV
jgi:electron transfer flavoprotein beta subunit